MRLDPPEFERVNACCWLPPTGTLPRFMLDGLMLKYAGVTPVPVSEIEVLQLFSLFPMDLSATTDIPPAAIPPVSGENVTLKVTLCCGARVKGKVGPEKLKPVPVTLSWKIVRLVLPLLLTETGSVLLLPTVTSPKAIGERESAVWAFAIAADRRNARRMKFHQACLHWKMRSLIGLTLFPRAH